MSRPTLVMLLSCLLACASCFAQTSDRVVLFSFEEGLTGWWTNPWGGGKASIELVPGKYGQALGMSWEDVPRGGNIISAYFDENAPWRGPQWRFLSLWYRGDGSQATVNLIVHCQSADGKELSYSRPLPMDSTQWRRCSYDLRTFWNREGIPFDSARIRRLLISGTGTRRMAIDQIALETRRRAQPLEAEGELPAGAPEVELAALDDSWLLRLDPAGLGGKSQVSATFTWPDGTSSQATPVEVSWPPQDDVLVSVPASDLSEGTANLTLGVRSEAGTKLELKYRFAAHYSQQVREPQLGLLPTPKQIQVREDSPGMNLSGEVTVRSYGPAELLGTVPQYLEEQLRDRWRLPTKAMPSESGSGLAFLTLTTGRGPSGVPGNLMAQLRLRGPEAYALLVDENGATVAATARAGLRYGAITLLQLVAETQRAGNANLPWVRIVDWPSLPVRAISASLPTDRWGHPNDAPADPAFFERFLVRTCLEHKLNTVVLLVRQGMKYRLHPEIDGPAAWSQDTVRHLVQTLKSYDINPIPLLDSLGHCNWLVVPFKQLREDGDTHTLCTRHPDSKRILLDCYSEVIDVFQPTYFHLGLDEVRWQTLNTPEENRCKLCAGLDKRDVFVEQVSMLHDYLTSRGIKAMMWGDMVLRAHNGGPPFNLADIVEKLPRDITISNWSKTLDEESNYRFQRLGFPVIQSNSRGVNPAQAPEVTGNMFGVWDKTPWLTEGAVGVKDEYCYLPIIEAAEYSWNLYPDALASQPPMEDSFFAPRLAALTRTALEAPEAGAQPLSLPGVATDASCRAGALVFTPAQKPVAISPESPVKVSLGRRLQALYLLTAATVPAEKDALYKRLQSKDCWKGLPVAELVVRYEDNTEVTRPISYGLDVRDAVKQTLPYTYNAVGYWTDGEGRTWYALQWVNPRPDQPIREVEIRPLAAEAQMLLSGLCVQPTP